MSFYTAEEQVHFLFSQIGLVKKVIMGLNRFTFRPAGFCFVECVAADLIYYPFQIQFSTAFQFVYSNAFRCLFFLTRAQILSEAARPRRRVLLEQCDAGRHGDSL
jgi:hypothetical protein